MGLDTILVVLVILVIFYVVFSSFRVLPEYERFVVLRLGKYAGTRGPGLTFIMPFLESTRKVDMRERFLEIPRQTAISKDNTAIDIDFLVYYRVVNPKLSILEIENVVQASLNIAATTLRAVIGDIELDDVLAKREQINAIMQARMDEVTDRWGVKVNAVEIREITPPRDIQEAMSRQMSAERNRRAVVTESEGTREAAITIANGNRDSAILNAEGAKQSAILNAEGNRQAAILNAEGYAIALERIFQAARQIDEKTLSLQYLEMMKELAAGPSTKWILPMELTTFVQGFARNVAAATTAGSGDGNSAR
jgi:regulator of protease activity HflC (stomatin/prohibitin superfamily)